jgi:hypothetical protein
VLVEALKYAAARLSGHPDPHGLLSELIALEARHGRCRKHWQPHLERSRAAVLAAAAALPAQRRRTALVLGSGLLLEVPLAELAALFSRVILVDLAFPPAVSRLARRLGNVELLPRDLTGCLDALTTHAAPTAPAVPAPRLGLESPDLWPDLDFAYSANVLSQLPVFALEALRGKAKTMPEPVLADFAAGLIRAHLDWLAALPCPALLLTDTVEHARPMPGQSRPRQEPGPGYEADLLYGVAHGLAGESWTWHMAPAGEAAPGLDIWREVLSAPVTGALSGSPA